MAKVMQPDRAVFPGKCETSDMTALWATSLTDNITPASELPGQVQESEGGMARKTRKKRKYRSGLKLARKPMDVVQNRSDKINSGFELSGGFFTLLHIARVLQDRSVAGVSPITVAFFTLWGYWNLYYYRSINQKWSLRATIFITAMNSVWLVLLLYYSMKGA